MLNLKIKKVIQIEAHFSPAQWCLIGPAAPLADRLNQRLEQVINVLQFTKCGTRSQLVKLMCEYADLGADSPDARCFLEQILNGIYGKDNELGEPA